MLHKKLKTFHPFNILWLAIVYKGLELIHNFTGDDLDFQNQN